MLKRKIILAFFIFLILFQISFFVSSDEPLENPELTFIEQLDLLKNEGNLDYLISEDGKTIDLLLGEGNFEFGENSIEHISTEDSPNSKIVVDISGNVLEASLFNKEASKYIINGNEFEIPADSHFKYGEEIYELPKKTKVNKLVLNTTIIGEDIYLFDEFRLKSTGAGDSKTMGKCSLTDIGYLLESGEANYKGLKITSSTKGNVLIVKDSFFDLSNYKGNYIKRTEDNLKIQSYENGENIKVKFLEGNGFFNMNGENLEGNQEKILSIYLGDGDLIEIFDRSEYFDEPIVPLIRHTAKNGFATITNGRHVFKFKEDKFLEDFKNLNYVNSVASSLDIDSNVKYLSGKVLSVDDNSKYTITDIKSGNILTFDTPLNRDLNYEFSSPENEKIHNFAEDLIGKSAYREGGRGDVCYTERSDGTYFKEENPTSVIVGDCFFALGGAFEENLPPDLRAFDVLEKKGWEKNIIEPSSIIGKIKNAEGLKNMPEGSAVFLCTPSPNPGEKEGVDYITYINEEKEEIYLHVTHTLISTFDDPKKGFGFINFLPVYYEDILPKIAREYNEQLAREGKPDYYTGVAKIGYLKNVNDQYVYYVTKS